MAEIRKTSSRDSTPSLEDGPVGRTTVVGLQQADWRRPQGPLNPAEAVAFTVGKKHRVRLSRDELDFLVKTCYGDHRKASEVPEAEMRAMMACRHLTYGQLFRLEVERRMADESRLRRTGFKTD